MPEQACVASPPARLRIRYSRAVVLSSHRFLIQIPCCDFWLAWLWMFYGTSLMIQKHLARNGTCEQTLLKHVKNFPLWFSATAVTVSRIRLSSKITKARSIFLLWLSQHNRIFCIVRAQSPTRCAARLILLKALDFGLFPACLRPIGDTSAVRRRVPTADCTSTTQVRRERGLVLTASPIDRSLWCACGFLCR